MVYQGPVRPGQNEATFRETGKSVPLTGKDIIGAGKSAGEEASRKLNEAISQGGGNVVTGEPPKTSSGSRSRSSSRTVLEQQDIISPSIQQRGSATSEQVQVMTADVIKRQQTLRKAQELAESPIREYERSKQAQIDVERRRLLGEPVETIQFGGERDSTQELINPYGQVLPDDELINRAIRGDSAAQRTAATEVLVETQQKAIQDEAVEIGQRYIDSKRVDIQDAEIRISNKLNEESTRLYDRYLAGQIGDSEYDRLRKELNAKYQYEYSLVVGKVVNEAIVLSNKHAQDRSKELNTQLKDISNKRRVYELPEKAIEGALFSTIPVGRAGKYIAGGILGYSAGTVAAEAASGDIKGAGLSLLETGTFLAGGLAGGRVAGSRVAAARAVEAEAAFANAQAITTTVGAGTDGVLKRIALSDEAKLTLKTARERGFNIELVETKYRAASSSDQKIINEYDPRAYSIRITARDGTLIQSYAVGEVVVKTPNGKPVTAPFRDMITGEIEKKTFTGVAERLEGTIRSNRFTPVSKARYFVVSEETARETAKDLGRTRTQTSTRVSLMDMPTGELPNFLSTRESLIRLRNVREGTTKRGRDVSKTETVSLFQDVKEQPFTVDTRGERLFGKVKGGKSTSFSLTDNLLSEPRVAGDSNLGLSRRKVSKPREQKGTKAKEEPSLFDSPLVDTEALRISDLPRNVGGEGKSPSLFEGRSTVKTANIAAEESLFGELSLGLDVPRPTGRQLRAGTKVKTNLRGSILEDFSLLSDNNSLSKLNGMMLLKNDLDEDTLTGGRDFSLLGGDNLFRTDEDTITRTDQRGRQDQKPDQATDSMLDFGSGLGGFDFAPPKPPRPVTAMPSLFEDEPRPVRTSVTGEDAFDVYGLQDATDKSQAKWIKLNKKPLTDDSALDVGAWAVDNSISARFKVKKTTGKPTSLDDSPIGNYWEMNQGKFRDYKVKRGSKFSLMDEYIEKSNDRLDTSGEVQDISLAKLMKTRGGSLFKKSGRSRGFSLW